MSSNDALIPQTMFQDDASKLIASEIEDGSDKATITGKLMALQGIDQNAAAKIVEDNYSRIYMEVVAREAASTVTMDKLPLAIVAGSVSAAVCGVLWGLITGFTGYEIGYMAWGAGLASGVLVLLAAKGQKGLPLQVIAVASSLGAIFIGKYVAFYYFLKEMLVEKGETEALAAISILSPKVFAIFLGAFTDMIGGFDALWVILAVITAWKIPQKNVIVEKA